MRIWSKVWLIGTMGILSLGVSNTRADLEIGASVQIHTVADFY